VIAPCESPLTYYGLWTPATQIRQIECGPYYTTVLNASQPKLSSEASKQSLEVAEIEANIAPIIELRYGLGKTAPLYQDGNILHRDISENSVVITDAKKEGEPRGMLIDLDLAKELDSGPSGARYRTGTVEFTAIEVLEGTAHAYRRDLESFFYVFLNG
jgi:serine/threonine protein kinase